MTEGNFVDYIKVYATSGKGGQGSVHLHREKYITKGGPDGGDGGRGGHIILRGDKNMWTLFHLKFKRHFRAEGGGAGSKSRSTGHDAEDIFIDVPLGTIIRDADTDEIIVEITENLLGFMIIQIHLCILIKCHCLTPTLKEWGQSPIPCNSCQYHIYDTEN